MLDGIQDSDAHRAQSAPRPDPRPHVFVGESSPKRRALLVETLREESCVVVEAADGAALVDALVHCLTGHPPRAPDLILLQVRLPIWGGVDILQRLRRFDSRTPVILISDGGDLSLIEEGLRLGVTGVLAHPLDLRRLRELARKALGGQAGGGEAVR